jgi:hypothetical protein
MKCTTFNRFSDAIRAMETELNWQCFTVGNRGKKPYHFWVPGRFGGYYVFRCLDSGHAGACRRIDEKGIYKVYHE